MSKRVGIINNNDGNFYGIALLSGDVPATIQAAAKEWDGGYYAYVPDGETYTAYLLPDDWNDEDHQDGQNRDTIETVKAGIKVGSCGAISLDGPSRSYNEKEVEKADDLRKSIMIEDGHRVDIEVDPDIEFQSLDNGNGSEDRLATITLHIAGTWFDGIKTLRASEWIDADGDFEEVDSHFSCNDLTEWQRAIPGPEFESDAWAKVKSMILAAKIPLVEEEDDDQDEDESEEEDDDQEDDDLTKEEAEEALKTIDSELFVVGFDPYRNHRIKVGQYIDGRSAFINAGWFGSYREIVEAVAEGFWLKDEDDQED